MRWGWFVAVLCAQGAWSVGHSYAEAEPVSPVERALSRWEDASAGLLGVGPMEHRRLFYLHHGEHSAHEIALVNEFRGPVSTADLSRRFLWSLKSSAEAPILVGRPRDEIEKLFYSKVIVSLDRETGLPETVAFQTRNQKTSEPLAVVLSPRVEEPNLLRPSPTARPLQYASLDEPRRPSPVRFVEHTAQKTPPPKPELSPIVQQALSVWETRALTIQSLQANVRRYTYEAEHRIERRAVGELSYFDAPLVRCVLKPATVAPQQQSHRRAPDGSAYELLPSAAEYWEHTPTEIRAAHHPNEPLSVLHHVGGTRTDVRGASHEEFSGPARPEMVPPWNMLYHVPAGELTERFLIKLTDSEHLMHWTFTPRKPGDIGGFREMEVLLDKTTWLPSAVKLINSQGDVESVYTFEYTCIEPRPTAGREPAWRPE